MSVEQSSRNRVTPQHTPTEVTVESGPYDSGDVTDETRRALVDFCSLLVPVPPDARARAEHRPHERWPGVHIDAPVGYLRLHVLAAPKSSSLWDQLSLNIFASLDGQKSRVSREQGSWGVEITCTSSDSVTRFIGVDGPRWTLYGVATGSVELAAEQASALRSIMRGTVVVRGDSPHPANSTLPLANPPALESDTVDTAEPEAAEAPEAAVPGPDERQAATPAPQPSAPQPSAPPAVPMPPARAWPASMRQPTLSVPTQPRPAGMDPREYPVAPPRTAEHRRPEAGSPRRARSIGQLIPPVDPPTEPIRIRPAPTRDDNARRALQQRLFVLEAVVAAVHRHRELIPLIAAAENLADAVAAIRAFLDVSEPCAVAVLELPWNQLTANRRRSIVAERDELRSHLYAADWNWS